MTAAVLGLGANLGDARAALSAAVGALAEVSSVRLRDVSGLWRSAPVGGPEQPEFHNAVALVDIELSADELLALGQELEDAAGRVRDVRWGPRTLDVDLLDVAGVVRSGARLTLPHPRAHERGFVLAPWAEVAPDWVLTPADHDSRPVAAWAAAVVAGTAPDALVRVEGGTWWR